MQFFFHLLRFKQYPLPVRFSAYQEICRQKRKLTSILRLTMNLGIIMPALIMPAMAQDSATDEEPFLNDEWRASLRETNFAKSDIHLPFLLAPDTLDRVIPSLNKPEFVNSKQPDIVFDDREPMIVVKIGKKIRAYPLRYMLWYYVINDVIAGKPILVTYNPYTDSFGVYSSSIKSKNYNFVYTGLLYQGSLVIKDIETSSLFLQIHGKGAVGELKDETLKRIGAQHISWKKFLRLYRNQSSQVMRTPEYANDYIIYGKTPFSGYDSQLNSYYYVGSHIPDSAKLQKFARIISFGNRSTGRSLSFLKKRKQIDLRSQRIRIRWEEGMASMQDTFDLKNGRDVGMVFVEAQNNNGSWRAIPYYQDFAFSFLSFFPGRRILHD